jgi:hypothetical protein
MYNYDIPLTVTAFAAGIKNWLGLFEQSLGVS